jgi:hypothetical protein
MDEKTYHQSGKTLTSEFQQQVFSYVRTRGSYGVTDAELQGYFDKGHGSTSSALSTLHKNGYICRLKEKRGRFTVYVAPGHVDDRETHPPYTNKGLIPTSCTGDCDNPACMSMEKMYQDLLETYQMARK